jgi:putative glutamine amidotransferase
MDRKKPLIGISTRMDLGGDRYYLRKQYSEAVSHAGGVPVLIPLLADREQCRELLRVCDGILLSGSNSDVDPQRYLAEPHPCLGSVVRQRDETDLYLLEELFKAGKPLLGICYGIQILNVFLGGTLWQDIAAQLGGSVQHSQEGCQECPAHCLTVRRNSLLDSLAEQSSVLVNSFHHQAIRDVAGALVATAVAADGITEAVEMKQSDQFVLGVQWHPELGWEKDGMSQRIFSSLVSHARDLLH